MPNKLIEMGQICNVLTWNNLQIFGKYKKQNIEQCVCVCVCLYVLLHVKKNKCLILCLI